MPQMERAPSPGPDESAFLSIFYPWPPYVTLGYLDESKNCARWLACFVGQDNLLAMFHKPNSPNTIIIEIKKGLTVRKMREILGQHDWEKVFPKHDAKKEGGTHSQVFYSTFRTRRDVEKTGWKVRLVTDDWFKGFNPTSGAKVAYPYPATTFCKPPELAETVNALELFRPLPGCIFPEASQPPAPTEGTQTPPTAPPPRNVPGGGGRAGASSGNVNASGGKGKKKVADPNVRPTAPVTRSAEASAKAKATQSRPSGITSNAYDEDSEGDDGYGNYAMRHQYEEEEEPKRKPGHGTRNLTGRMRNAQVRGYSEDPFVHAKPQELSPDDICPFHRKPNCRPAVCEWAGKRREVEKQRQNRTKGRLGQNIRRWDC